MSEREPFLRYVPRTQEQRQIITELKKVRATGKSRAVLLYGRGGTGKTRLVRQLPGIHQDPTVIWLDPVDVDDSQHWLLSNLEKYVADCLDPDRRYFGPYFGFVSELPRQRLTPTSREAVISHLNRIKEVFTECYQTYIAGTGSSVVITFDTIEAIGDMYLLRTLARWIKVLPGTLFILAGRSLAAALNRRDSIRTALEDPPLAMDVTTIRLEEFDAENCRRYLAPISELAGLEAELTEKLVHLTQGHPLWLAFTVDYLVNMGLPPETDASLEAIKTDLPYHGVPTAAGRHRAESFKRHLVAPYQGTDFWHEAITRLAVVRESVSQPVWLDLMADRPLPADVADTDQAWEILRNTEWIRPRANRRYVTLHDAVAEELAQRIIDLHDPDGRWRQELWARAAGIYANQTRELEDRLADRQMDVDVRLRALHTAKEGPGPAPEEEAALIQDVTELDGVRQELNQLQAAHLFYRLLSDFAGGAQQFVRLLRQARGGNDVQLEDLLAFQMQRFLPGGADEHILGDAIGAAIQRFRAWLPDEGRESYLDIGLEMAAYLIDREQVDAALNLLNRVPEPPDHQRRYRLRNLQGNACLRIPGRVREGGERFQQALAEASQVPLPDDQNRYRANAYKELGFYYRNIGLWKEADESYAMARDAISRTLSPLSDDADREEMASVYTNWAYVKGIGGRYDDGINLVESAITVRRRIGRRYEQAISCSVKGEVYRYQRQFKEAWVAYAEAAELFEEQTSWSWLGVIFQEQAICLFQAIPADVYLLPPPRDPVEEAEFLILRSLDLCRALNVRAYPSALNRAGRIFRDKDPDRGLRYLEEGATRAQDLSDGWFWLENLIDYAELSYRTWLETNDPRYRELIPPIAEKLHGPDAAELEFPELRGRWNILQGNLAMHEALAGNENALDIALENYRIGFPLITRGWVGEYGASAIPEEFRKFIDLVWKLPAETREHWHQELYRSWSNQGDSATQLLARLEELY